MLLDHSAAGMWKVTFLPVPTWLHESCFSVRGQNILCCVYTDLSSHLDNFRSTKWLHFKQMVFFFPPWGVGFCQLWPDPIHKNENTVNPIVSHFSNGETLTFPPLSYCLSALAGHRVCLGELLARTELFLFFSNLMRAFTFRLPEGVKEINTEAIMWSTLQPHPYKICAVPR